MDFEALLKASIPFIKRRCAKFQPYNISDRELLYSVVLEKAWTYRHKFKGDEVDFQKWMYSVVKNCYIDMYRKEVRIPKKVDIETIFTQEKFDVVKDISDKELIDSIFKNIKSRFSEKFLLVFKKHVIDGMKYQEIVDETGINMNNVKGIIFQIRTFIKSKYI